MKGTKLYNLLKSLSKDEMKQLHKAVKSPLLNTNPTIICLFERLKHRHPNFDASLSARRKLYRKVFPDKPFNDQLLRRLFTQLSAIVEKFLLLQSLEDDSNRRQQMLVEIYDKRGIVPLFKQEVRNLHEQQLAKEIKDADWYFNRYQLLYVQYSSVHHVKYDPKDKTLEEAIHCLDNFFALRKIYLDIGLKSKQKIYNVKKENDFLTIPATSQVTNNKLYKVYDLASRLLVRDDSETFESYESLLKSYVSELSANDQLLLFFNGLNYLNRKVNNGASSLNKKILDWYKWGLEANILLQKGQISPITFGNIVTCGCKSEDFVWTRRFIEQYRMYLSEDVRENEATYSEAVLLFAQKSYDQVASKLSNYVFSHRYKLKTKNLLSRTYFELSLHNFDYHELVFASLKNYENYLYRDENFNKAVIKPHLNFIQILKGFTQQVNMPQTNTEKITWLKAQLEKRSKVISRNWFLGFETRVV